MKHEKRCPFRMICQHEKMGLVICNEKTKKPIKTCYMYVLLKNKEKRRKLCENIL
jgi:hypothetical protein